MSASFGHDRGTPIDRVFIRRFLDRHRADVRGRVVELHPADYTHAVGGGQVVTSTVIGLGHDDEPDVIEADLALADSMPDAAFDCFILTQALQYMADPATACRNAWRCLAPGGVLLVTAPALSRMDPGDHWPEYWRFTPTGLKHLLRSAGPWSELSVEGPGNVLAGAAFLYGLAAEEVRGAALEHQDDDFPLIACARAVKAGAVP